MSVAATVRARRLALAGAVAAIALLRWLTRAHEYDSWDAIGFMRAVHDFDLARFQPHFPGYPVYVALCKLVRRPGLVSAIASAATGLALFRLAAAGRDDGARAGFVALGLWAGALSPWLTGGAALADATATALVAAAFAALTFAGARAALLGGVAIALAIGARVSYWPLALSFALVIARERSRAEVRAALAGAAAAGAAWLVPFVAVVGPRALVALGRVQLVGHFTDWGGSIATRPDLFARVAAFARDLVYDGIWPSAPALAAALVIAALATRAWRPSSRALSLAVIVVVPYALWALLAQNVLEQPRHLLPLVAALVVALARAVRPAVAGGALVALAFAASTPLIARRGPPAAAVIAERVARAYPNANDAIVFARRSARVMSAAVPSLAVGNADRVSDILGTLERLPVLPRHVFYVAEELADDEPRHTHAADASLHVCRDARVDRQSPCVTLRSYDVLR